MRGSKRAATAKSTAARTASLTESTSSVRPRTPDSESAARTEPLADALAAVVEVFAPAPRFGNFESFASFDEPADVFVAFAPFAAFEKAPFSASASEKTGTALDT